MIPNIAISQRPYKKILAKNCCNSRVLHLRKLWAHYCFITTLQNVPTHRTCPRLCVLFMELLAQAMFTTRTSGSVFCSTELLAQAMFTTRTSGSVFLVLGTVTVSTPLSTLAFTDSTFAFSGKRKRRKNFPCERSTRCHVSVFFSSSRVRSPLICSVRSPSNVTFTSSFCSPETTVNERKIS